MATRQYYKEHKTEIIDKATKYRNAHKPQIAERMHKHYQAHKSERAKYNKEYYQTHKLEAAEKNRVYRQTHKMELEEARKCYYQSHKIERAKYNKEYSRTHRIEIATWNKEYHLIHRPQIRIEVLTHYGNGKLACIKCGYTDIRALSIDHINGNGNGHRRKIGKGLHFDEWLKRNDLPQGYQTLCMNCQFTKRIENKEYTSQIADTRGS